MHLKTLKMIATSGFLTALECTKFVFGRGSAPDPAGGAHDAPPDPLVGWGGGYPLPIPHPLDAFGVSVSSPTATRSSTPPTVLISPPMLGVWITLWDALNEVFLQVGRHTSRVHSSSRSVNH